MIILFTSGDDPKAQVHSCKYPGMHGQYPLLGFSSRESRPRKKEASVGDPTATNTYDFYILQNTRQNIPYGSLQHNSDNDYTPIPDVIQRDTYTKDHNIHIPYYFDLRCFLWREVIQVGIWVEKGRIRNRTGHGCFGR